MICKNCNKKIKDGSLFCPRCGMIPSISAHCSTEEPVANKKALINENFQKAIHCGLPFMSVLMVILWFCKTISLNAGSNTGLYSIDLSLFFFFRGFALLSVAVTLASLAVRILLALKKEKRCIILYAVSVFPDILSMGCIIYKLIDVQSGVSGGVYTNLNSADFSLNILGWLFIVLCALSLLFHVILIVNICKEERRD